MKLSLYREINIIYWDIRPNGGIKMSHYNKWFVETTKRLIFDNSGPLNGALPFKGAPPLKPLYAWFYGIGLGPIKRKQKN